jgi:hypothetical protein
MAACVLYVWGMRRALPRVVARASTTDSFNLKSNLDQIADPQPTLSNEAPVGYLRASATSVISG